MATVYFMYCLIGLSVLLDWSYIYSDTFTAAGGLTLNRARCAPNAFMAETIYVIMSGPPNILVSHLEHKQTFG